MRTLLGAVSFLTILKVPGEPVPPGRAALFFPLVGAWIGAAGGGIFLGARMFLPVSLAALLTVAFWTAISGVLHEDGLADVADALRAGRSKETMLAILKDSRIGTYGAVAIVLSVIARWQALEHITSPLVLGVCILAQTIPRAAIVGLAWVSRPVGMGLGHALASTLTTPVALLAAAQGLLAAFALGARSGAIITVGVYLTLRAARWYFYRRIGGVNGDCLGAVEQILEIFVLVVFTCMICGW